MKECLYCKKTIKKNETEHFTCEVCGAAMCHDCYDLDTEHNNHYHARTLTIFNIKTLKRVSYGFNSFTNMRIRIFLINGLIKIK